MASKIRRDDGHLLDATFSIEQRDSCITVIYESGGGTRGTAKARNSDYKEGLEQLLRRLATLGVVINDALLDSGSTAHLPIAERRLWLKGRTYPLVIDDPCELRRRLGAAQAKAGRRPEATGSGNPNKRIQLVLGIPDGHHYELANLEQTLATGRGLQPATVHKVGAPYRMAEEMINVSQPEPFAVDPQAVERGTRGHATTQNALAEFLRARGIEPRSPSPDTPEFDLAWELNKTIYVAEVKSVTLANEEKQLRLGLGQILRYRHLLMEATRKVTVAVLVVEHEPTDATWRDLCRDVGVVLVWPGNFDPLLDARH